MLDQAAEVTLTSRPGGVSVRWRLAAALTDDERAGAMAVIVAHAGWMSGKLPMHGEVVEIVLRTGRVPQDVVSGMAEQPFGNLQHTVRLTPASTLEIPRPASELLSQLSI